MGRVIFLSLSGQRARGCEYVGHHVTYIVCVCVSNTGYANGVGSVIYCYNTKWHYYTMSVFVIDVVTEILLVTFLVF